MYQGASVSQETFPDISGNFRSRLAERAAEISVTPDELRDVTFKKTFLGYAPVAVNNMLHRAAMAIEELALQRQEIERLTRDGADNARLRADIRATEQRLTAAETENAELRSQTEGLRQQITALRHQITTGELANRNEADEIAAQQIVVLQSHVDTLKAENTELINRVATLQKALDDSIHIAVETVCTISPEHEALDVLVGSLQTTIGQVENAVTSAKEIFTKEAISILQAAKTQAADLVAAADNSAAALLADARGQAEQIREEILATREKTEQHARAYRSLLESHLQSFSAQ